MKKTILFIMTISLLSCKKEDENELSNDNSNESQSTSSTIQLSYSELAYSTLNCVFTYTDVNGVRYENLSDMDKKIENVDFSKPFSVTAQAGVTFYPVGQPPQPQPQTCSWVLKKDGYVIDTRVTSSYYYQN